MLADQHSLETTALLADAVVMATGGIGLIYGQTTNSVICTASAAARCYMQGVWYANGELIQIHPTAIAGTDKCRLISESVRGEGGRVWVPKQAGDPRKGVDIPESERWYFLEEKYPKYGNLVPRDVASRELFDVCVNQGMGVGGKWEVYLDVSHIPEKTLRHKLEGVLEIYEKFMGENPYHTPMRVFPAMHYTMGGIYCGYGTETDRKADLPAGWEQYKHMTNVNGLFAGGEADYQYHGANRLGANSLLSCLWAGQVIGPEVVKYLKNSKLPELREADVARRRGRAGAGVRRDDQAGRPGEPLRHPARAGGVDGASTAPSCATTRSWKRWTGRSTSGSTAGSMSASPTARASPTRKCSMYASCATA